MISPSTSPARFSAGLCILTGAFLVVALMGCTEKAGGPGGGGGRGRGAAGAAAPVLVSQAERKVVPLVLDAVGSVEPIRNATVRSQITGTLFKIEIREGQEVNQGDLLFEIDPRPYENTLRSALADQQRIAVQLETARTQAARYKTLKTGSMVSDEQFQQIQDAARVLEAQAAVSEAAVASAKLQLSYCSIRAPLSGRTGNLTVHEGDLIRSNDTTPMVTIVQMSPIYVTFSLAQQHLADVARYKSEGTVKVDVMTTDSSAILAKGELTFIDNTVDSTTGTIKLKATLANESQMLWPGQFAAVQLTLATPEVLTVPIKAVQTSQKGQHVFVVNDATAELRPVVIERTLGETAVVAKGLTAGETIIVDGQLRVVAGGPVQVKSPDNPAAPVPNAPVAESQERKRGEGRGKAKSENKGS